MRDGREYTEMQHRGLGLHVLGGEAVAFLCKARRGGCTEMRVEGLCRAFANLSQWTPKPPYSGGARGARGPAGARGARGPGPVGPGLPAGPPAGARGQEQQQKEQRQEHG